MLNLFCVFQVVNLDKDRTVAVSGPKHIAKMRNILKNIHNKCDLITHLGRKCGALLLQMMMVGVTAIAHLGGWDRDAKTMEQVYATMPEADTMAVASGFGSRNLYHLPRDDINPLELQHPALQQLFQEADPWREVAGLQKKAEQVLQGGRLPQHIFVIVGWVFMHPVQKRFQYI